MKKFKLKLITPLILTLMLQGCMPNSLTKFTKDPPTKAVSSSVVAAPPVVDSSGTVVPFTQPTSLFYGGALNTLFNINTKTAGTPITITVDGTLNDKAVGSQFIVGCSLVTTGNPQTSPLPSGLSLSSTDCSISGTATINKSITTAFCSDLVSADQTTCESAPLVWNALTGTCSNTDFQYANQADCVAGFNKWYPVGSQIPYKVKLTYRDGSSPPVQYSIYATAEIGCYTKLASIDYTQSDKLLLQTTTADASVYGAIVPVRTSITGNYPASNIISSQDGIQGVANFVNGTQNTIGIKKLVKITLSNAAVFGAGGFITTLGDAKKGKIFKKDPNNTNIVYVENISAGEIYFAVGDQLDSVSPFATIKASITAIDDTLIFSSAATPNLDNDLQFFSPKIKLSSDPTSSYLANSPTPIKSLRPITTIMPNNGTAFSISPRLPVGLSLDPATGIISGIFAKALASTAFTITAANPLGGVTYPLTLIAADPPADLSLSTKQIITVSTTAFFAEGETLYRAISPPSAEMTQGKILKILNGYQMAIDTSNGAFLAGSSLDSGSGFFSEKAFIIPDASCVNTNYLTQADCETAGLTWSIGSIFYNLALKLDGTSAFYKVGTCSLPAFTTQATCEDAIGVWGPTYVNSAGGAKGVLAGVFRAANDILFIRHLTQNAAGIATAKTFIQGESLDTSGLHIAEVDYNYIKMDLIPNAAAFNIGGDVTSRDSVSGKTQTGGYTYNKNANTIYVSDLSKAPTSSLFKNSDSIYPSEFAGAFPSAITISSVTHDILLVTERGKSTVINTSLSSGNGVFSISPDLPLGLALDTKTGQITGTPTTVTPKKDFTLTATNFVGQVTYVFSMEVRDYFSISDASGAPSFLMHKIGDTQIDRKCRVNASDIINNNSGALLDVRCHLEGQEEDVAFNPIKFQASAGPGVCQYVQYAPYFFWQYSPKQSNNTSAAYPAVVTINSGCLTSGIVPTADMCDGNYSAYGASGPNCDEGKLEYHAQSYAMDSATPPNCIPSGPLTTQYVACGGKKVSCIAGPVKDLLDDAKLSGGYRSMIYQTPNGVTQSWTLSTPISKGDLSNMRVANSTTHNQCSTSNADVKAWTDKSTATADTTNPFGRASPYYVFNCLNAANQIKARIRVIVREWDRDFKINYGIDLDDPSLTDGIASDAHGPFMNNATADAFNTPYNDHNDWDNDYTNLGSCSILPATLKSEYSCVSNGGTWTYAGAGYTGGACGVKGGGVEYPYPQSDI